MSKRVGKDLTEGPILPQLIAFTVPVLLTNVIQQLYNTVDLAVIGHFGGTTGTVGVSNGGEIATLLSFICMGFAGAGQVYISQLAGAKEQEKTKKAVGTFLTWMALLSAVFMVFSLLFCRPLLELINTPQAAMEEARDYMLITAFGLPFIFGYNAVCSILRGMGESKRPLVFIIIAATSNIIMDVFFVVVLKMGAAGTAYATVIAQIASCIAAFVFMYKRREEMDLELGISSFRIYKEPFKILLKLGIPSVIQQFCIHVTQLYCNSQVNTYGIVASAVNSVGNKVARFVNIFANSITTGTGVIIGQNLSVKKYDRVKSAVNYSLIICTGLFIISTALSLLIPRQLFAIFTKDPEVIAYGPVFMRIAIITFGLAVPHGVYGSVITGSGNAKLGLIIGLLDGIILRLVISLTFANVLGMGFIGYFYGNSLPRLAPAIIGFVYYTSGKWKTRKLLTE